MTQRDDSMIVSVIVKQRIWRVGLNSSESLPFQPQACSMPYFQEEKKKVYAMNHQLLSQYFRFFDEMQFLS